jgi:APA family basic amino acid/polyamine antiporter
MSAEENPRPPGADGAPTLARELGLIDITLLVMGSVIGAGIFVVPHDVAALVPQPALVLAVWVLGGLVSLAGSLVYAELARRRPQVGGQYAYLRDAYHPAVAFVYGWSLLLVVQSGGMAWIAVTFAEYSVELARAVGEWLGLGESLRTLVRWSKDLSPVPVAGPVLATAAIGTVTAVNCLGVRTGGTLQNVFMILKILGIIALVLCGLLAVEPVWPILENSSAADGGIWAMGPWQLAALLGAALVPVLFAYGGWHTTTFMAGEIRDPRRTLSRGLVLGVVGVIGVYVAANVAYLRALGVEGLAATAAPASEVMRRALGAPGAAVLSLGIAVSAFGFLSQATLTSPRVYYAMAKDGCFFQAIARVHPRTRVPVTAIVLQGLVATVIAVSGTFHQIINYVMSVEMVFLSMTAMSLFIIRRQDGVTEVARLSVPGHPATTVLFAVMTMALVGVLFYKYPVNSAVGIGIALAGIPVYFCWRPVRRAESGAREPGGGGCPGE